MLSSVFYKLGFINFMGLEPFLKLFQVLEATLQLILFHNKIS
nr:MAG TPA: hypothetical protein [Bacteriophage sp.]